MVLMKEDGHDRQILFTYSTVLLWVSQKKQYIQQTSSQVNATFVGCSARRRKRNSNTMIAELPVQLMLL